jgi:hypothetical protein
MVELIDDFLAEYPAATGSDKVDTGKADEVIDAIAKTVAELTSQQDGIIRQQVIEQRRVSPGRRRACSRNLRTPLSGVRGLELHDPVTEDCIPTASSLVCSVIILA